MVEAKMNYTNAWHLLNIDSLTNDCAFGLEYYNMGNYEKAKPLLMKGIEFCDMIEKGSLATIQEVINSSYLDAWENFQILVKYKSPDELRNMVKKSALVKKDLENMIKENSICNIDKISNMQRFFNESGAPFLRGASSLIRRH
jgi:hypothetical protein